MSVPLAEWKQRSTTNAIYVEAKRVADDLGLPFTWKIADVAIPAKCPVFGMPLEYSKPKRHPATPVAILIDPALGFTRGNVRIVSYTAAAIRGEVTPADLRAVADYLAKEGAPEHGA